MPPDPADGLSSVAHAPSELESLLQTLSFDSAPFALVPSARARLARVPADESAGVDSPWDPHRAAQVLLRWLEGGLVVLVEDSTTPDGTQEVTECRQLTYGEARDVLADPARWPLRSDAAR